MIIYANKVTYDETLRWHDIVQSSGGEKGLEIEFNTVSSDSINHVNVMNPHKNSDYCSPGECPWLAILWVCDAVVGKIWQSVTPQGKSDPFGFPKLPCVSFPSAAFNLYPSLVINITMRIIAFHVISESFLANLRVVWEARNL